MPSVYAFLELRAVLLPIFTVCKYVRNGFCIQSQKTVNLRNKGLLVLGFLALDFVQNHKDELLLQGHT